MKKLLAVLLFGVLTVGLLGGCGSNVDAEKLQEVQDNLAVVNESVEQKDERGIIGSNYLGLVTALEVGLGFPSTEIKESGEKGIKYTSISEINLDSGIRQAYMMSYDTANQIVEADFMTANINQIDEAVFIESAGIYFSLLANVSYEAADSDAAKKWLEENIVNISEDGISTVIGDAEFTLECSKTNENTLGTITFMVKKDTVE